MAAQTQNDTQVLSAQHNLAAHGTTEINIFASLSAEQASSLVNRACRWEDPDRSPGVMIAKVGDILTPKMLQKMILRLSDPLPGGYNKEARGIHGIQFCGLNAIPISKHASGSLLPHNVSRCLR